MSGLRSAAREGRAEAMHFVPHCSLRSNFEGVSGRVRTARHCTAYTVRETGRFTGYGDVGGLKPRRTFGYGMNNRGDLLDAPYCRVLQVACSVSTFVDHTD